MTTSAIRRLPALPLALVLLTGLLVALGRSEPAAAAEPIELKVGEFNIEYGGTHVSFDKVVQAIRRGGADVVGIEEAQTHIPRLARALGWPYFSERLQVVSKYPLIDPPGADGHYLFVEVAPGEVVAIQNVHLPSNPYGPFRIKQGESRAEVLAIERRLRVPAIEVTLDASRPLLDAHIPTFIVGDFNTPTWQDWTERMVGVRPQIRYPVRWPVSLAVEAAGFVDSYRDVYPNPREDPGLTWWADRPKLFGGYPPNSAPQDRIDLIYATPDATPTASIVVGERNSGLADVGVKPWPSDHRSVVTTFTVTPAPMPTLVAVSKMLREVGQDVEVRFHSAGGANERVVMVPAGGDPTTDGVATQSTGAGQPADGTLTFATTGWDAGAYEAVLVDKSGTDLSRIPFWLKPIHAPVEISTGKHRYTVGDAIDVSWIYAPARRWDWVGIYKRGRDPHVAYYLLWSYTGATVEGTMALGEDAHGPWPLPRGKYTAYLLTDDGYKSLARADFDIGG
jgi:endonuclease/exonuclease/phosphatase family metal-dependent hydrolase